MAEILYGNNRSNNYPSICMNTRQRFQNTMHFQPTDRLFRWETLGMWPETLERWYAEGLNPAYKQPGPKDQQALKVDEYARVLVHEFGFDRLDYLRHAVISGYTESPFCPAFEFTVLQEEGGTRVVRDIDGIIKREFTHNATSSMPQFIEYPVKTRQDFIRLLPRLDPLHPQRLADDWEDTCHFYAGRDFPVGLTVCGAYGHPRNLLGVENLSLAYYDQPQLIHEIMEQWCEFYCRLADRVWQDIPFDFVLFWEDMAYKNGPLISPRLMKEFMLPYYKRFIEHMRALGCDVFIVDSDGDVNLLVPLFVSVGVNAMLPFEVQAGMDIRTFRKTYGRLLAIIGGIDKRTLARGKSEISVEIKTRMHPMLELGGYIPCLDHTVPPDVSLENFRIYIDKVRSLTSEW